MRESYGRYTGRLREVQGYEEVPVRLLPGHREAANKVTERVWEVYVRGSYSRYTGRQLKVYGKAGIREGYGRLRQVYGKAIESTWGG